MKAIIPLLLKGYAGLLLPLLVVFILLEKLAHLLHPVVQALESKLHLKSLFGVAAISIISIILMLILGVVAGWIIKAPFVRRWVEKLENNFLRRIPMYNLLKSVAVEETGESSSQKWQPALLHNEGVFSLCKIIDESEHFYTIIQGAVTLHSAGEVKVVPKNIVVKLNISILELDKYEKVHGRNYAALVEKYAEKFYTGNQ